MMAVINNVKGYEKAHEISDSYTPAESLGLIYMSLKNITKARKWFVLALKRGCARAQSWLNDIDNDMKDARI